MTLQRDHSTNGLAKSTHQFIQTIMLAGVLGLGGWCWHLLTTNSDRLIRVEDRQQMVLEEHVIFRAEFQRLFDRMDKYDQTRPKP